MKDRLAQLRAVQEEIPLEEVAIANATQEGISIGEGEGLDSFLSRCSNSLNDLERLKEYLERMKIIHATILSKPEHDGELRSLMAKFATESKQLRSIAHELDFEANKTRSTNQSAAHRRIKKEQSRMFSSALFQVINNFNIEQESYKTKHLQGISRSLQIQGLEVSDEDVLSAIDKGEIGTLTKGLMLAVSDKTALFHEVKSRQEEILALESGIRELHELFQDIQHLGEMVNNIEQHIDVAGEYVIKGQKDIKIIKKAQKRARKKPYPYKMARTRPDTFGDAFIKLVSSDGHEFIIKKKLALKSGTINSMLSGPGQYVESENNEVNFREIPSRVLRKVCHFFSYTSCYTGFYAEIPEFEIDAEEALELLMTANFLDC